MTTYDEDDLFEMDEQEFCQKYGVTKEEYNLLVKATQEV